MLGLFSREFLGGKSCRVSGQLLTFSRSLRPNEEQVGCLLLFAACLSASIGGKLAFVEARNHLQVLSRFPVFGQLPFALPAQTLDQLGQHFYSLETHGGTDDLKLNFSSCHSPL